MIDRCAKVWLERDGNSILSGGRARLLEFIDSTGSLRKAADAMGMSYRHAWGVVRKISEHLGTPVLRSSRGGSQGGSSELTPTGHQLLDQYRNLDTAVQSIVRYGRKPSLTVDGVVLVNGKLVLIKRKNPPYQGQFALPGGFVDYGETVEAAVVRELEEEISVATEIERLIGVYSAPDRDPRGHTVSVAYHCRIVAGTIEAADDAAATVLVALDELPQLAFDHQRIIDDFITTDDK